MRSAKSLGVATCLALFAASVPILADCLPNRYHGGPTPPPGCPTDPTGPPSNPWVVLLDDPPGVAAGAYLPPRPGRNTDYLLNDDTLSSLKHHLLLEFKNMSASSQTLKVLYRQENASHVVVVRRNIVRSLSPGQVVTIAHPINNGVDSRDALVYDEDITSPFGPSLNSGKGIIEVCMRWGQGVALNLPGNGNLFYGIAVVEPTFTGGGGHAEVGADGDLDAEPGDLSDYLTIDVEPPPPLPAVSAWGMTLMAALLAMGLAVKILRGQRTTS